MDMKYNLQVHHRRSIRLQGYDYSQAGAYFITICIKNREYLLGDIVNGQMCLNEYGKMVEHYWLEINQHFKHVELDEYIIMPNHIHGIIVILENDTVGTINNEWVINVGAIHELPLRKTNESPQQKTNESSACIQRRKMLLPKIIGWFKMQSAKHINQIRQMPGIPVWQRNYYEHIIRDENELNKIRAYIINNPLKWDEDEENKK